MRCGAKDHWAKDCMRPKKETPSGKGSKGSGKQMTLEGEDVTLTKDDSKGKGKAKSKTKSKTKTKQGKSKLAEGLEIGEEEWNEEHFPEPPLESSQLQEDEFQARTP